MGCDIHLHVERRKKGASGDFIHSSFRDKFSDRIYGMFAKLADVRNYSTYKIAPISNPRGLPEDISYLTRVAFGLYVTDHSPDEQGCCSKKQAEKWVMGGLSKWIDDCHITNPDWHSASWATVDEMNQAINEVFYSKGIWVGDYVEWVALLAYMRALEDNGNYEVRAVFWFDN